MTQTEEKVVLYEVTDGIAICTLNRPDRLNAWTGQMQTEWFDALDLAAADPGVRVIVTTGAGRGFCAGADMALLQGIGDGSATTGGDERLLLHPTTIPKPVIAAINGAVAGIGFAAALMCDMRFAAKGAKFTSAFSRRGLIAEHGTSWTLPRLIGPARAMDVMLSARVFLAEEAHELGVVNQLFEPDELMDATLAYARDLAANCSPISMAVMKRQLWTDLARDLEPSLRDANRLMAESLTKPDFREGVASFVEKRAPDFAPVTQAP